jgi:hypothetical protein
MNRSSAEPGRKLVGTTIADRFEVLAFARAGGMTIANEDQRRRFRERPMANDRLAKLARELA